jgi:dipeptidyl aminopeptidase/acylaminoacyl peptidase
MPAGPVWTRDGRSILIKVGEQGNANLVRIDVAGGKLEPVTKGNQDVMSYTADSNARRFAYVRSTPTVLGDLHVVDVTAPDASRKLRAGSSSRRRSTRRRNTR